MLELFNGLWAWASTQSWSGYLTILVTIAYILTLLIPALPVSVTTKIPDWVMRLLNLLAAKRLTVKANLTDNNGNAK